MIWPAIGNLEGMTETLRSMKSVVSPGMYWRVELRVLTKPVREQCEKEPYAGFCRQSGCFVVQFVLSGKMDHTVYVDGHRRLM